MIMIAQMWNKVLLQLFTKKSLCEMEDLIFIFPIRISMLI